MPVRISLISFTCRRHTKISNEGDACVASIASVVMSGVAECCAHAFTLFSVVTAPTQVLHGGLRGRGNTKRPETLAYRARLGIFSILRSYSASRGLVTLTAERRRTPIPMF